MTKEITRDSSQGSSNQEQLHLPTFSQGLEIALSRGESLPVDGTNVVRVPFGIRQPIKKRPQRPERRVTLVLPFQPLGSPTPPPQAA